LPISLRRSERDNTGVVYGESFIYKSFRRLEDGVNPDLELGRELTKAGFSGAAQVVGHIEYHRRGAEPSTLGVLHKFIPNQGTAWQYTLDQLSAYFERVAALSRQAPPSATKLVGEMENGVSVDGWHELLGSYLETVRAIARRTAELHTVLANVRTPSFVPEPFGKLYQRSIYQSMRNLTGRLCGRLVRERSELPAEARLIAERLAASQNDLLKRFRGVLEGELGGARIRCHGDYHLAQLLHTGKEFVIIDFEGEPTRPLGERRLKRSPLRDVASMVRSFDYAAQSVLLERASSRGRSPGLIRPEDRVLLSGWATAWYNRVSHEFVTAYVAAMSRSDLLPDTEERLLMFLDLLVLEKALQEIDTELTHRTDWVAIPLRGALRLLGQEPNDLDLRL
jgi:maltose alpha-D-glucosyltransferase/alpha-amylase